jgi:hypothetical protein
VSKNAAADVEKSNFKEVPVESLFSSKGDDKEKVKVLVTKNSKGEWVQAFKLDESTNENVANAGWKAANMLNDYHAMMRMELTDGW